jgi:hypothetical protein
MRILITKEGKIIMNELEEEDYPNQFKTERAFFSSNKNNLSKNKNIRGRNFNFLETQNNSIHKRNLTSSNFLNYTNNPLKIKNNFNYNNNNNYNSNNNNNNNFHFKNHTINFNDDEEINIKSIKSLNSIKSIKIANKKYNLPKSLTDKFYNNNINLPKNNNNNNNNNDDDNNNNKNSILFNDNFPFINNTEPNESKNTKKLKFYSFREIIPNSTINSIKKQIISNKKIKDKLSKITDDKFRSNYEIFTEIEKFNNILDYPILNSNKKSLIKYLNVKKNINPLNLKKILNSNNEKLNKINKLCQQLFYTEEKNKLFKEIIGEKIKSKNNDKKIEANRKMNELKNDIDGIKNCLNKYNKQFDKREKYRERFNDVVVHYWSKYNYDKLNKEGMPKNKYVSESYFNDN